MTTKDKLPVAKNQEIEVKITDLTYQGLGVGKIDNFPVFISDALPGETVKAKVTKVKKNFAWGKLLDIITKSPDRVDGVDARYTQSGIAPLQHLKYEKQLEFKRHQIQEQFKKNHLDVSVLPTIGMEHPNKYRNKAQIPVRNVNGELQTGFFRRHSHELIPIEDFYIQDKKIDEAIIKVRDILAKNKVSAYNEDNHSGVIRNIMIRRGKKTSELMVVLVTNGKELPHKDEIVAEIKQAVPDLVSLVQNINDTTGNRLMGKKNIVLAGADHIKDELLGTQFLISPMSFFQVNPVQTEKLYQLAIDRAQLKPTDLVVDAYCGIGTISLAVAPHVKHVYGVDVVSEAIADAKENAKLNGITNCTFITGKAEKQMPKWASDGLKPDVVIVDPPRKGLDKNFIESVVNVHPDRVVYVSCNPSTLARDANLFLDNGYQINQPIQPVDQFPQTPHVESVTVFEKKEKG